MDFIIGNRMPGRKRFLSITGTIVELLPAGVGGRRTDGCILFAGVEDTEGNTVNFMVTPATYVVDFETLSVDRKSVV